MSKYANTWPAWPMTEIERDQANIAQRDRVREAMRKLRAKRKAEGYKALPVPGLPKAVREIVEDVIVELVDKPSHPTYREDRGEGLDAILGVVRRRLIGAGLFDPRREDMPIASRGLGVILRSKGYEVGRGTTMDYGFTVQYVRGKWLPRELAPKPMG